MEYNLKKHIDFLLENACPSIRYLVHRDILKTPTDKLFTALKNKNFSQ